MILRLDAYELPTSLSENVTLEQQNFVNPCKHEYLNLHGDALRDLVPFVQLKKNVKSTRGGV